MPPSGVNDKKITEWAWQLLLAVRRWYPKREIVAVADRAYASLKYSIDAVAPIRSSSSPACGLDAALYEPAPPRRPGQIGRPRLKGERCPTFPRWPKTPTPFGSPLRSPTGTGAGSAWSRSLPNSRVVLHGPVRCTLTLGLDPRSGGRVQNPGPPVHRPRCRSEQILRWFVMRWQLEVTFQEVRRHLGFETQRQWSEMAIRRTTPALLGLFSLITLFAHRQMATGGGCLPAGGMVPQEIRPSQTLWRWCARICGQAATFHGSPAETDTVKVPGHSGTPNRRGLLCSVNG